MSLQDVFLAIRLMHDHAQKQRWQPHQKPLNRQQAWHQ